MKKDNKADIFGKSAIAEITDDWENWVGSFDAPWKQWVVGTATVLPASIFATVGGVTVDAIKCVGQGIENMRHAIAESNNNNKNKLIQQYNSMIKDFNNAKTAFELSWNKLNKQEDILNKAKSLSIKHDPKYKTIMAIGITGFGKSVICNRLIGIEGDIADMAENTEEEKEKYNKLGDKAKLTFKKTHFWVGEENSSETRNLDMVRKIVNISIGNTKKKFELTVIDTPGSYDTIKNLNEYFETVMVECCKVVGGINAFLLHFKYGQCGRFDENYENLVKKYQEFWGKDFWKYCIIIIVGCDFTKKKTEERIKKKLPGKKNEIREDLKKIANCGDDVINNLPMFAFGEDNYENSIKEIFFKINVNATNANKYHYHKDVSPLDEQINDCKNKRIRYETLLRQVKDLERLINAWNN